MVSRSFACVAIKIPLLAMLIFPIGLTAQNNQGHRHKYHHYQLVDMGTFGGPQSGFFNLPSGIGRPLNNRGIVAGVGDTSTLDPFSPNYCFSPDCYVSHAFQWQNGVKTDLGMLLGSFSSDTVYISDSGLIVSDAENGEIDPLVSGLPEVHAVLWQNGNPIDLGTVEGGYESYPNGVNKHGQVVGIATNTIPDPNAMPTNFPYPYQSRAFFWENGVMQDLGTLGTGTDAQAAFINDRGQVVGYSYTSSAPSAACANSGFGFNLATGSFIWDKKKGMRDLGSFGGSCTLTFGINDRGQVIGQSTLTGDQVTHAFVWDRTTGLTDLGTLGGSFSGAQAISKNGEIVGGSVLLGDVGPHAVLWQEQAGKWQATDLGTVDHSNCSYGIAINAIGQVIGNSGFNCGKHAFLWEGGGPMVSLNTLVPAGSGLSIVEAVTINDRAEIAVNGHDADGNDHALLMIPCDENHPGVEGCDYSLADPTGAPQSSAPRYTPSRTQRPGQSRRTSRYHIPGPVWPSN